MWKKGESLSPRGKKRKLIKKREGRPVYTLLRDEHIGEEGSQTREKFEFVKRQNCGSKAATRSEEKTNENN